MIYSTGLGVIQPNLNGTRRHVLSDLQPYYCIIPRCKFGSTAFADKSLWSQHLQLEHASDLPESWTKTCGLCKQELGGSLVSVTHHMTQHLEEVSLMILSPSAEYDEENQSLHSGDEIIPSIYLDQIGKAHGDAVLISLMDYPDWTDVAHAFDLPPSPGLFDYHGVDTVCFSTPLTPFKFFEPL